MEHPHIQGLSEWRPLARGRLAVVWEARQLSLDRLVAVKVYHRELDEGDRRRFLQEAATGNLSDHPGIVTTHDAGVLPDDRPYLIMELRSGQSLSEWLKPQNRPSEEQVRQVGLGIADALAAVHARGVLHRNVSPANILIDSFGNPGLADFAQAAMTGAEETADLPPQPALAYAPPETFLRQPATRSGDVYSLAATLYALLTGSPARRVDAAHVTLEQMAEVAYRPIDRLPGVNSSFMDVLITALSNDPAARPTAAKFRDLLANVPELRNSEPGPHAGGAGDTSAASPPERPQVPAHSAGSNGHSFAVLAGSASSQRASEGASGEAPRRHGNHRGGIVALIAAVVIVITSAATWLISEPTTSGVPAPMTQSVASSGPSPSEGDSPSGVSSARSPTSSTTPGASDNTDSGSAKRGTIQVGDSPKSAMPFQTIPIQGTYHGGAEILLRVQGLENGRWMTFPIPAKTDQSGDFTAYVELGRPGRYLLRIVDADSGVQSEPFVVVIRN
jgi:serine/threonine protein kinase